MLEFNRRPLPNWTENASERSSSAREGVYTLQLASLVRHKYVVAVTIWLALGFGVFFRSVIPETYTANSQLILTNRSIQLYGQEAIVVSQPVDTSFIQNQIEVLQSDPVLERVVRALALDRDPSFPFEALTTVSAFLQSFWTTGTNRLTDLRPNGNAVRALKSHLVVTRIGYSHIVQIRAKALEPDRAAALANGVARAYLEELTESNAEAAQTASAWLRERAKAVGPNARVVTKAARPAGKDGPGDLLILGGSLAGGVLLSGVLAIALDLRDRTVRTQEHARQCAGTECFGFLTEISSRSALAKSALGQTPETAGWTPYVVDRKLAWVLDHPDSISCHTLCHAAVAAVQEFKGGHRRIGITSCLAGEGKTLVAGNLALLLASSGKRVLLVDAAGCNSALSRGLAPDAPRGLHDVLNGTISLREAIWSDQRTGMHFLPAGKSTGSPAGLFLSESLDEIMSNASAFYEWIVFDLPPLVPYADARAAAHIVDAFLMVVHWGQTRRTVIREALRASGPVHGKLLGVVLNRADWDVLGTYEKPR